MKTLKMLVAAGAICSTMALAAPVEAQVQTATSGFDGYRAIAVTAGVIAGTMVAIVVTDGLIIPVYAWATGGGAAAAGSGWAGMSMGGIASESVMIGGATPAATPAGAGLFRGGMRLLGAISGGLLADSWYTGR